MARNRKSEQLSLDVGERGGARHPGRVERRVAATIARAKREDVLGALDDGLCVAAVDLARGADEVGPSSGAFQPYAYAPLMRELRETLTRLRLDPTTRSTASRDAFDQFLDDVAAAEQAARAGGGDAPPS